jgi:hypothetical protein
MLQHQKSIFVVVRSHCAGTASRGAQIETREDVANADRSSVCRLQHIGSMTSHTRSPDEALS